MSDEKIVDSTPSVDDDASQAQPEPKDEIAGILAGKEAETKKRQDAEARATAAEHELRTYKELQIQPIVQQPVVEDDYLEDDYPTNASVQKMIDKKLAGIQQATSQTSFNQQVQLARLKHNDYDDVVTSVGSAFDKVQVDNPGLAQAIGGLPNAPEIAYMIGKAHPDVQKKVIEEQLKMATDKIDENLNKPNLSNAGGQAKMAEESKSISNMSKEDFDKLEQETLNLPHAKG